MTDGARRLAAWGVHALTASGAPAGILALLATARGDARSAFAWMAYTLAVDAIDGTLARAVEVKRVLPQIDGTRLDDIVDYFTYVIVPAFFLLQMGMLPASIGIGVALCPVMASAFGFTRADAKTDDHYFTGFPSYWNILAFYLYLLHWPTGLNAAIVIALSVAVFVPVRYVYPSRTVALRMFTVSLGVCWSALSLYLLWQLEQASYGLVLASLAFPAYYFVLSFALQLRRTS